MAQWQGQFSGKTHETKAEDIEASLRHAAQAYRTTSDSDLAKKWKALIHLAERLLAARLKVLRARLSMLTERGSEDSEIVSLRHFEQQLQAQNAEDVLREFGF